MKNIASKITGSILLEMRYWEDSRTRQQSLLKELKTYEVDGVKNIINPDPLNELFPADLQETLEERILDLKNKIKSESELMNRISDKLYEHGIDVEHVVTDAFEDLKQKLVVGIYEIVRSKSDHGKYRYILRDFNSRKTISEYDSWDSALHAVIISKTAPLTESDLIKYKQLVAYI